MFLTASTKWVLKCPVTLVICCFGIVGNVISALVWRRLKKKGSTPANTNICNYFILLPILDIFVLLFSVICDVLPIMHPKLIESTETLYGLFFIYVLHPLHFYFLFTSIFLVTILSIERLKYIMRPFASLTFSKKSSIGLLVFVFLISCVVNIPSFFEFRIIEKNETHHLVPIDYAKYPMYRNIVFFSHCIFGLAIPWVITLICNIVLIAKCFTRLQMTPTNTRQNSVNGETVHILKTTIAITFSTLLLLSVQCVSRCFKMFILLESDPNWMLIQNTADIGHIAIPLNSAINFLMFYLPGAYFRKEMSKMFFEMRHG